MDIELYINKLYIKLLNDNLAGKIFENFSEKKCKELIKKNIGNFFLYCQQIKCAECKSLNKCSNNIKGFELMPIYNSKFKTIQFKFNKCEKNKLKLYENKARPNFKICHYNNFTRKISDVRVEIIKNLKDNNQKKTLNFAKILSERFIRDKKKIPSFFVYSANSSYKSFLIEAFCNEIIEIKKDIKIIFIKMLTLINKFKSHISQGNLHDFQANLINYACEADILIIDDFGKEKFSSWIHMEVIYIIIERRTSKLKPIIFISCLNILDLKKYYTNGINFSQVNSFVNLINQNIIPQTLKKQRIVSL